MDPLPPDEVARAQAGVAGSSMADVARFRSGIIEQATVRIGDEVPIALEYNGISHAVMLATPADLEEFALGFSLSEGLVERPSEVYDVEVRPSREGITLAIEVASATFIRLKERRRTLAGRTGCGICGTESLDHVLRPMPDLSGRGPRIARDALAKAIGALPPLQPLWHETGATHAAAWCSPTGDALLVREDVGRHNALDKLIGAMARARHDAGDGFVLITSRASVEIVQKSACVGIALVAAFSAPTSLAIRLAADCGQTLIGFARDADFSVYTHAQRIA